MTAAVAVEQKTHTLVPRERWVLIKKLIRDEEVSEGGVIKPGEREEESRSRKGVVLALSNCAGRDRNGSEIAWDIKVGDMVLFSNFAMDVPDVEELTGEANVYLVQADEIYCRVV